MHTIDQIPATEITWNISDYLRLNAERSPHKPALLYPEKITYKEMEEVVNKYSYGLEDAGIKAGTKTIIMVPAGDEFFYLTFALLRIGAIPVMIDPGMGIKAMARALKDLNAEAFIGIPKARILRVLSPEIFRSVNKTIIINCKRHHDKKKSGHFQNGPTGIYPSYPVGKDNIAAIFFTSGSTGPAKGVIYTAGMLKSQIRVTRSHFNISSDDIDLCTFPLLGLFAICYGNSSVMADMDMMHPARLNPAKIIKNIRDHGCTRMFGSPMVINRLSQYGSAAGNKLPSLRIIITAGAPVHRHIMASFSKMLSGEAIIHTPYGATEALPVTDITGSELLRFDHDETGNESDICIGYPVEGIDVIIIEITDNPIGSWDQARQLNADEIGEIVVKAPWVTSEYFNNSDANLYSKIPGLRNNEIWHRMGDLGKIDRNGRLWFHGRKSQRVVTCGGTLYTIPVEAVFNRHPHVARSALVGIPVNDPGEKRPVICIQLKPGFSPSKLLIGELHESANEGRSTKGISDFLFVRKFPVDPRHNAKIFREKLAKWAAKKIK